MTPDEEFDQLQVRLDYVWAKLPDETKGEPLWQSWMMTTQFLANAVRMLLMAAPPGSEELVAEIADGLRDTVSAIENEVENKVGPASSTQP